MAAPRVLPSEKQEKRAAKKKPKSDTYATLKAIIFVLSCIGLISFSAHYFTGYTPKPVAEKFYMDRKSPGDYQKLKDAESAKKKSEKNIFLQ